MKLFVSLFSTTTVKHVNASGRAASGYLSVSLNRQLLHEFLNKNIQMNFQLGACLMSEVQRLAMTAVVHLHVLFNPPPSPPPGLHHPGCRRAGSPQRRSRR